MNITASSVNGKIVITLSAAGNYRLERRQYNCDSWLVWTAKGFDLPTEDNPCIAVTSCDVLDSNAVENTLFQYRFCNFETENPAESDYISSDWVKCGDTSAIGYTFGNYEVPEGKWGTLVTPDDIRYTYLWGTDFKATNGASYTDAQIQYFIDAATEEVARQLNIAIVKKRIRYDAKKRNMEKGKDYDVSESFYDFKFNRIARYGLIPTRERPILELHSLRRLSRFGYNSNEELKDFVIVDNNKGVLKLLKRPTRPQQTREMINQAVNPYGKDQFEAHLFYCIDYDVGYETSDDVPADLRQTIAKYAAVSLLNIIGDGLMSGFSSSSLSMDGLSESFSSTQSATSAYFGARIKEYKDDIDRYIKANKNKFANMVIGSI